MTQTQRNIQLGQDFNGCINVNGMTINVAEGNIEVWGAKNTRSYREIKPPIREQRTVLNPHLVDADHTLIRNGEVVLNLTSSHLKDLPYSARATLLVPSINLADMDGQGLGTWIDSAERLRQIENFCGISGMKLPDADVTIDAPQKYEESVARTIRQDFETACTTGQTITTGLFIPPIKLVAGHDHSQYRDIIIDIPNNFRSMQTRKKETGRDFLPLKSRWESLKDLLMSDFIHDEEIFWTSRVETPRAPHLDANKVIRGASLKFDQSHLSRPDEKEWATCPVALEIHPS